MRVVLTGASGQLGTYVHQRLAGDGHDVIAWSHCASGEWGGSRFLKVDLTDRSATAAALAAADPELIVHAAAISTIEAVRVNPEHARIVNVTATQQLAEWCGQRGRRIVYTSTDLVFDGRRGWYREDDPPGPLMAYGRTKLEAESAVIAVSGGLVARLSLLFGPSLTNRLAHFDRLVAGLREGRAQTLFEDEFRTPLDLATAAEALVRLAEIGASGCVHVGGRERVSRFTLARRIASALGFDPELVRANCQRDVDSPEPRPADVSLDTGRLVSLLPDLHRPSIEAALRL